LAALPSGNPQCAADVRFRHFYTVEIPRPLGKHPVNKSTSWCRRSGSIRHDLRENQSGVEHLAMAVAIAGMTGTAIAQEAQTATQDATSSFGDIVVTATKRSENVAKVPISITAFSGDQLKALGVTDTTQITQHVPGLQLNAWSPNVTIFNLRGISQNNFTDYWKARSRSMSTMPTWGRSTAFPASCSMCSAWKCCAGRRARCSAATPPAA
jgi:hypothetical protein